ncbi:MFS general substrate transporter [Irpex rosettiformis]|uniref:MFS general substrate transporter n=1 Tax=Irpex rosettiformis TaxID=378272 RepID=A0ACB8U956_9APHY|nr:MFS general substrate transporter [Irpex rosettiformis]
MAILPTSEEKLENKDEASIELVEVVAPNIAVNDEYTQILASEIRPAAERQLVRALDYRLLPTIILIFILNYIDRVAVSAARLQGLEQELGLTDAQYEGVIAILYASYVPCQIPSNMILNRVSRPSWYIPLCTCLWGMASALTGVTKSYAGILATRFFIGLPEAAFYPGAMYLLSRWYTRKELAFRSAIIYGGLLISNTFGSLMAAGILSNMDGAMGIRGWRWLFYIEGAITVCVGLFSIWALPDYPHNTRWLSSAQRRLAQVRLAEDVGEADEDSSEDSAWTGLKQAVSDPIVCLFAVMTMAQLLGMSFVNFFPTLTAALGFSTTLSLVLCAPPWILSTIVCSINAWHADRTGERYFHMAGLWWAVIVGYIISLSTDAVGGRYVTLFLMASGYSSASHRFSRDLLPQLHVAYFLYKKTFYYQGFALTLVWVSNAVPRPPAKRSVSMGIVNGFGNIGNMIGSSIWKASWGPSYHNSMIIATVALLVSSVLAFGIRQMLIAENKRLDHEDRCMTPAKRQRIEEAARLEGLTFEEALERNKGFRHLY